MRWRRLEAKEGPRHVLYGLLYWGSITLTQWDLNLPHRLPVHTIIVESQVQEIFGARWAMCFSITAGSMQQEHNVCRCRVLMAAAHLGMSQAGGKGTEPTYRGNCHCAGARPITESVALVSAARSPSPKGGKVGKCKHTEFHRELAANELLIAKLFPHATSGTRRRRLVLSSRNWCSVVARADRKMGDYEVWVKHSHTVGSLRHCPCPLGLQHFRLRGMKGA